MEPPPPVRVRVPRPPPPRGTWLEFLRAVANSMGMSLRCFVMRLWQASGVASGEDHEATTKNKKSKNSDKTTGSKKKGRRKNKKKGGKKNRKKGGKKNKKKGGKKKPEAEEDKNREEVEEEDAPEEDEEEEEEEENEEEEEEGDDDDDEEEEEEEEDDDEEEEEDDEIQEEEEKHAKEALARQKRKEEEAMRKKLLAAMEAVEMQRKEDARRRTQEAIEMREEVMKMREEAKAEASTARRSAATREDQEHVHDSYWSKNCDKSKKPCLSCYLDPNVKRPQEIGNDEEFQRHVKRFHKAKGVRIGKCSKKGCGVIGKMTDIELHQRYCHGMD